MSGVSERVTGPDGSVQEVSTWEHKGVAFTALGSLVSDTHLVGYPKGSVLQSWDGRSIATLVVTGHARGFYGSVLVCYRATLPDGRSYVGRGLGDMMILKLRRAR